MPYLSKETLYGLDIETECAVQDCNEAPECKHALSFNHNRITLICVSNDDDVNLIFKSVKEFKYWLEGEPNARFTAHNGKFDFKNILVRSLMLDLVDRWVEDSSLLAFVYQDKISSDWLDGYEHVRREQNKKRTGIKHRKAGPHSLKTCAPYYLGVEPFWEPEHGHDDEEYVLKDTKYCLRLTKYFLERLDERSLEFYYKKYLPWTKNLLRAELRGVLVDVNKLLLDHKASVQKSVHLEQKLKLQWKDYFELYKQEQALEIVKDAEGNPRKMRNVDTKIAKIPELNLDSPKQLLWLFNKLGVDAVNLDGKESTDKETLNRLAVIHPEVETLLEYRKVGKLNSTYYPKYLETYIHKNRIHCDFHVTEARTGRLSCREPNLQQVPGELHSLFIADEGKVLITRDLSAIEPTLLGYYSEDEALCNLLLNNGDFHSTNAKYAFGLECEESEVKTKYPELRKIAKTVGLAVLYGAGARRVYQSFIQAGLNNMSEEDAKRFVYNIRDLYSGVWKFKQELDRVLEGGDIVYNLLGRPFSVKPAQDVYMKGLNTLIQSSASDLLQQAAYDVSFNISQAEVLLLVHDELVTQCIEMEAKEVEGKIVYEMTKFPLQTRYGSIKIKTEGKISKTWEK